MSAEADTPSRWEDARLAAALFARDPQGLGGILVKAHAGPVRDAFLAYLKSLMPGGCLKLPPALAEDALSGGLDLAATLASGRPVTRPGLLARAAGGCLIVPMAERLEAGAAARLALALDGGAFGVVALDEGLDEEAAPSVLAERLALRIDLREVSLRDLEQPSLDTARMPPRGGAMAATGDAALETLCGLARELGVGSARASLFALRVARLSAARADRPAISEADLIVAARLVLVPRATLLPPLEPPEESPPDQQPSDDRSSAEPGELEPDRPLDDIVLAAALAAMPAGLLERLRAGRQRSRGQAGGRRGAAGLAARHGRPAGVRRGDPRGGARLDLIETLRAAAPWQPLRRRETPRASPSEIQVRRDDFRIRQLKRRMPATAIFAVDASGSSALHRLAEVKGAVELTLAQCYVRRDEVALIAFRNRGAELLLPPTRSLARARRELSRLPGGGGTPLASGIEAALALALALKRKGRLPAIVLLTDGRPNIARDGAPGRARAEADARAAARLVRAADIAAILVDTAPRPEAFARELAGEMAALYQPLPYADAGRLSRAVVDAAGRSAARHPA